MQTSRTIKDRVFDLTPPILLDRIFGTYREGEGVLVGQDDRRRLSIWEQTVFPFRPLIDKYVAWRARPQPAGKVAASASPEPSSEGRAAAGNAAPA